MDIWKILEKWISQELRYMIKNSSNKTNKELLLERREFTLALGELSSLGEEDGIFDKGEVIFLDFARLSPVLLKSPLSKAQKTAFVLWLIFKNNQSPYLAREYVPLFKISEDWVLDVPVGIKIESEIVKHDEIASKLEAMQIIFAIAIRRMARTEADIETVGNALAVLNVSPNLIRIMQTCLRKNIEQLNDIGDSLKESVRTMETQVINRPVRVASKQANIDRKYRLNVRKIEESYNLETGKLLRPLRFSEIVEVVSLMMAIDLKEQAIDDFVIKAMQSLMLSKDIVASYLELIDMFSFYAQDNLEIATKINQIEECLGELNMTESSTEQNIWRQMIQDTVQEIRQLLPIDSSYLKLVVRENKAKEYYDFTTGAILRPMTLEEIIETVKIFQQRRVDEKTIQEFIAKAQDALITLEEDPVDKYYELYGMLDFYRQIDPEIKTYIDNLDGQLLEIILLEQDGLDPAYSELGFKEQAAHSKLEFKEQLDFTLKLLPKDGKYIKEKIANGN